VKRPYNVAEGKERKKKERYSSHKNTLTKKKPMSQRSGSLNNKGNTTNKPRNSQIPEATELAIQELLVSDIPKSEYRVSYEDNTELFGISGSLLRTRVKTRVSNLCRKKVNGIRRYKHYPDPNESRYKLIPTHISPPSPSSSPAPTPLHPSSPQHTEDYQPTDLHPSSPQHTEDYQPTDLHPSSPQHTKDYQSTEMEEINLPIKDLSLDQKYHPDNDLLTFYAPGCMTQAGTGVMKIVVQKPVFDINDFLEYERYAAWLGVDPLTGFIDVLNIRRPTIPSAMYADAKGRNIDQHETKKRGSFVAKCDPLYQNQASLENEILRPKAIRTTVDVYKLRSALYPDNLSANNKYFNPIALGQADDLNLDTNLVPIFNPWKDTDDYGDKTDQIQLCPHIQWEFYIESSEQQVEVSQKRASKPRSLANGTRIKTHTG
jgi:hypothetical protein